VTRKVTTSKAAAEDLRAARKWLNQPGSGIGARSRFERIRFSIKELRETSCLWAVGDLPPYRERVAGEYVIVYRVFPDTGNNSDIGLLESFAMPQREIWSFFSGAMGLDLGLEAAGLKPTLANEIHPIFCRSIRLNRPEIDLIEGDIGTLTGDAIRKRRNYDSDVYLMVGGPPCQSFSPGGKRAGLADPRGNLIYEYFRLVSEIQPRYFVLENVANLATAALRHRPIEDRPGKHWNLKYYETERPSHKGVLNLEPDEMAGSAIKQLLSDVSSLGYYLTFGVVDAADYGAPQRRLRLVMLGSRDFPPPSLPVPTHGDGRQPHATVRDAISRLSDNPGPHSDYTAPMRRFFDLVPEGGSWRSLPPSLHREALGGAYNSGGGKTGFFRRLAWDAPSPTITGRANRKGSALCHPDATRPLSVRECAAIQGFPPEWEFSGAMNNQYMQVGNAVPVALGRAIGSAILSHEITAASAENWPQDIDAMIAGSIARLRSAGRNKRKAVPA
jgi:DNA (cytosine-5)-methyltransferase 1